MIHFIGEIVLNKIAYIEDMNEWKKGFQFYQQVKVRFSETDMFRHLNNTVPFIYFEEARIEFFKHIGLMEDWLQANSETIPVVADLQCDFIKQVFFNDELKVYVKAENIGRSSVDIHYMAVKDDEDICFVGRGTIVQMSIKTGKGVPFSEELKKKLNNIS